MDMFKDTRDNLTKQYFNEFNISLNGYFTPVALPNGVLDRDHAALLLGAPDESKVFVKQKNYGIWFEVTHPFFTSPREMLLDKAGTLHWEGFFLCDDAPDGIGTRIAAISLLAASEFGLSRVELMAWGPPHYNGHYTWPRLGFNAKFDSDEKVKLSWAGFPNVETVSELMETQLGRDWWKMNGWKMEMAFELDGESNSMQTLRKYIAQKGVEL